MGSYSQAIVATGLVFSDALSIAPYAAMNGYPILLSGNNTIRSDYNIPSKVTIVGGPLSVSTGVENTLKKKRLLPASAERTDTKCQRTLSTRLT